MKFSLIGPTYPFRGGLSHFTTSLVRTLRHENEVSFYSYSRQYPKLIFPGSVEADPSADVMSEQCERTIDSMNPLTWMRTARQIVAERPDAVVMQWWTPFWLPLSLRLARTVRRAGIPVIYICHQLSEPDAKRSEFRLAKLALSTSDGIVTTTKSEYEIARRVFPQKQVRAGHHPVYDGFPRTGLSKSDARAKLGLSLDAELLLMFGFMRPYKGIAHMLAALAKTERPVELVVAGEFWGGSEEYRAQISALGLGDRVKLHEHYVRNEEIETYFTAADGLALPYTSGAQSGVAAIALDFGLPIIASDIGGFSEIVINGETGYTVPPANPDALANAINRFFDDGGPDRFRDNVLARRDELSWESLADIIEEVSSELAHA